MVIGAYHQGAGADGQRLFGVGQAFPVGLGHEVAVLLEQLQVEGQAAQAGRIGGQRARLGEVVAGLVETPRQGQCLHQAQQQARVAAQPLFGEPPQPVDDGGELATGQPGPATGAQHGLEQRVIGALPGMPHGLFIFASAQEMGRGAAMQVADPFRLFDGQAAGEKIAQQRVMAVPAGLGQRQQEQLTYRQAFQLPGGTLGAQHGIAGGAVETLEHYRRTARSNTP